MAVRQQHFDIDLERGASEFVAKMLLRLESAGLTKMFSQVDHGCYRVATIDRYESIRAQIETSATLLSEAFINGRPIASYKLAKPIKVSSGMVVDVLELPSPREDATYEEGFEHIEVVTLTPLEDLLARHPDQPFNLQNFRASVNRDVSLRFEDGLVKFHEASLEKVIEIEKSQVAAMNTRPLAVVDFDDTVLASRMPFLKAVHAALETYFGRAISFDDVREKARPTFPEFFANFGVEGEASIRTLLGLFQESWPRFAAECHVPAGVRSLLSCLQSEGVDIHLWTARDKVTTQAALKETGLLKFFAEIHAFDGLSSGKPVPSSDLNAACRAASRVVMLGDNKSDLVASAALGAAFFQAGWVHRVTLDALPNSLCPTPLIATSKILSHFRG